MNQWANTVLTDKGTALLAKLTQGNTLSITRAVTGAGFVTPGLLAKQTEVTDPKQELSFRPVSYPETGKCAIPTALTNDSLETGYEATQVGIYAMDPDDGEILLFISQAPDAQSGTIIPSKTEMPGYAAEWTFYLAYGQADMVNVTVDQAGAVSRAEFEERMEKCATLGEDGKVPEEQLPDTTYIPVTSEVPADSDIWIDPNETAIEESHVTDRNNPHGVTAEQIGALAFTESTEYPGCYYREVTTTVEHGTITEKEWLNPPMRKYGVPYRTTKRFSGSPVYAMQINIGEPTSNSTKDVTAETEFQTVGSMDYVLYPSRITKTDFLCSDMDTARTMWDGVSGYVWSNGNLFCVRLKSTVTFEEYSYPCAELYLEFTAYWVY